MSYTWAWCFFYVRQFWNNIIVLPVAELFSSVQRICMSFNRCRWYICNFDGSLDGMLIIILVATEFWYGRIQIGITMVSLIITTIWVGTFKMKILIFLSHILIKPLLGFEMVAKWSCFHWNIPFSCLTLASPNLLFFLIYHFFGVHISLVLLYKFGIWGCGMFVTTKRCKTNGCMWNAGRQWSEVPVVERHSNVLTIYVEW